MPNNDRAFYTGGKKEHNRSGGSYGQNSSNIKAFSALAKAKKADKEKELFNLFSMLNDNFRQHEAKAFEILYNVYSGNDNEFLDQLRSFLGDKVNISSGMETNALVKALYTKILQPFLSQDNILTITPKDKNIKLAEKCQALFNDQIKDEGFIEEITKTLKDGFIYGKGFLSLGWKKEIKILPKKTIHKTITTDERGNEQVSNSATYEEEIITIEAPDFKSESPTNILYPQVSRWKDVPFVIRMESISAHEFNNRYGKKEDELLLEEHVSEYELDFDRTLSRIPVLGENFGGATDNEVEVLHFYFKDETYYVCRLSKTTSSGYLSNSYTNLELVYEGRSPVAGMAIPVFIFIPEPLTGRLTGESLVAISMQDQRKITEFDNLYSQSMRNNAMSPIFYNDSTGLNIADYLERTPNMPIKIQGEMDTIKKMDLEQINPALLQLSSYYNSRMKENLGATDFFSGNIGRATALSDDIHTPKGLVKNGDLKVGDRVCTPDGKSAEILELFPQGEKDLYSLKLSDNTEVKATLEHLWEIYDSKRGKTEILSTKDILEKLRNKNWEGALPLGIVEYEEKPVNIDPYVLGLLLGDGSFYSPSSHVRLHTSDWEMVEYLQSLGICGYIGQEKETNGGDFWNVNLNKTIGEIRNLGLLETRCYDKFVPDQFKYNSKVIRYEVLRGLLDSDGHCCNPKTDASTIEFSVVSEKLANDVAFLVRSLGGYAKIVTAQSTSYKNGVKKIHGNKYRVFIRMPKGSENPFKIKRKANIWRPTKRNPQRRIKSVEFSHKEEAQCMVIDHPKHLYLCSGDNVVVTHNSSRLSSVDSLIGLATSRMSSYISQFNKFILEIADGLVLLNRAFLPETYVNLASSLYQPEPIESFSIPYPIKFSVNTPIQGQADLSVRLAALRECLNLAQQQEQMAAGTWDIVGLSAYFFATAGIKEVGKFLLKSPFTESETDMLKTVDQINRLLTNSALPNTENPQGLPQQQVDQAGQQQQGSFNNQSMQQANLNETTGF